MAELNGGQSKFTPSDAANGPPSENTLGSNAPLDTAKTVPLSDSSQSNLSSTQAHSSPTSDFPSGQGIKEPHASTVPHDPHHRETVEGTTWPTHSPPATKSPSSVPQRIGDFHLKREIGVGGMGKVYEAVDANLGRLVAIKVIKPGYGDAAAISRFRAESQTLAKFAHPGIAQVYAAGVFQPEGAPYPTPYFAMEFVPEALHITRFVEKHRLNAHDRIRLFMRVCEAIEHAHRFRIIHRDLKPSNIIISDAALSATSLAMASTGGPQPKVIDFGIARTVDTDARNTPGGLVGTIEYMSPEQCEGCPLDERSDVYALGVVLYQLLARKLPYPVASCGTTQEAVEIISAIRPKPLREISGELSGDIDAVVSKALEKNPDDRYQSVARLRADLDRCLTGDAVEARWGSVAYVLQRKVASWMGLHPRTSILTLLVALVLAVVTLGIELIFNTTPLPHLYGAFQSKLLGAHTLQDEFKHVTLITLDGTTKLDEVASSLGIEGFDENAIYQRRSMYASVLDRLSQVSPKAVMIDIKFPPPPLDIPEEQAADRLKHTSRLVSSIEKITKLHGIPVITASPFVQPTGSMDDPVDPAFASRVILGGHTFSSSLPGLYICYAFVKKPGEPTMPSLALATVAAAHVDIPEPQSQATLEPTPQGKGASIIRSLRRPEIYVSKSNLEVVPASQFGLQDSIGQINFQPVRLQLADIVEVSEHEPDAEALAANGITSGDQIGYFYTQVPEKSFAQSTIELSQVLSMDNQTLANHVNGKIVVLANTRPEPANDDFWPTGFGYDIPGPYLQAAAVESMMRGVSIKLMSGLHVVYVSAAACILGCIGAHLLRRRVVLAAFAVGAFTILITLLCVVLYKHWFVILNPFIAVLALLAGIAAYTLVYQMHHRRTGKARWATPV